MKVFQVNYSVDLREIEIEDEPEPVPSGDSQDDALRAVAGLMTKAAAKAMRPHVCIGQEPGISMRDSITIPACQFPDAQKILARFHQLAEEIAAQI